MLPCNVYRKPVHWPPFSHFYHFYFLHLHQLISVITPKELEKEVS